MLVSWTSHSRGAVQIDTSPGRAFDFFVPAFPGKPSQQQFGFSEFFLPSQAGTKQALGPKSLPVIGLVSREWRNTDT